MGGHHPDHAVRMAPRKLFKGGVVGGVSFDETNNESSY